MLRAGRWLWLLVFLFPLTLVAGRFCWFGPTDDAYHGLLMLHRVLPQIILAAAAISVATVHTVVPCLIYYAANALDWRRNLVRSSKLRPLQACS